MYRAFTLFMAWAVAICIPDCLQADVVFNLTDSYSSIDNPNGVWTLGWQIESSIGGSFINQFDSNQNASGGIADFNYWNSSTLAAIPYAGKYNSNTESSEFDGTVFNPNQFALHAGYSGSNVAAAIARFTAPLTAQYRIDQALFEFRSNIPGNQVYVLADGVNIFQSSVGTRGTQVGLSTPYFLTLNAGDHVDFIVGSRFGQTNSTTTQVNAQITQLSGIPEPASATLIGLVGTALGIVTFRKKGMHGLNR